MICISNGVGKGGQGLVCARLTPSMNIMLLHIYNRAALIPDTRKHYTVCKSKFILQKCIEIHFNITH